MRPIFILFGVFMYGVLASGFGIYANRIHRTDEVAACVSVVMSGLLLYLGLILASMQPPM